jgi:hypothetical protein
VAVDDGSTGATHEKKREAKRRRASRRAHSSSCVSSRPGYPAAPAIVALAKALRVSSDSLLGLKPLPKSATVTQPAEEKRLWRHLRVVAQLPERDQRAVLRLIDSAAKASKAG